MSVIISCSDHLHVHVTTCIRTCGQLYMHVVDGCDVETEELVLDGQAQGELDWNEVGIALTAYADCPCSQASILRQASRVCGGDFITGGSWMDSDKSPCEFDALALELCAATVCRPHYIGSHCVTFLL